MRWLFSTPAKIDHARVVAAIHQAEQKTSGEIRVLIARHRTSEPLAAARRHFHRLGMSKTRHRNAVLIFLAPRSRRFAVIGDRGVHEKCGDAFWSELAAAMAEDFKKGEFTHGLCRGIERAGELLARHFPRENGDADHPPDEVEEVD